jgi:eukaryotic-like serine/threonine-protein kinase
MSSEDSVLDPVGQLAEDFMARYRRGERPALSEYTDKHPELAERIRQVLPMMVMMEEAGSGEDALLGATADYATADTGRVARKLERVGGYRILREVARGGMGVVYEAEQVALGRHVALKVLPLHMAKKGTGLERFRREAMAAAKLHHTNIVPVFEVGEDGDVCYYAMQFIQGQSLDSVLEELKQLRAVSEGRQSPDPGLPSGNDVACSGVAQSLLTGHFQRNRDRDGAGGEPPLLDDRSSAGSSVVLPGQTESSAVATHHGNYYRSVARVGIQVAEALDYAHREGVIHRDIKPSNLLLDTDSRVWVTDFGLARQSDAEARGEAALTHTGDIVGTIRYMAPERFRGWSDPRSDVYSLGLTLHEMLLLRPAFEAPDRIKLIHHVTHDEPPRLRKVEPSIPRDLETIVHKAIDKEPGRRYQTAAELAADLERFVDDKPILARQTSGAERAWRWCKRNPAVAGLIAAVLLVAVTGFAATLRQTQIAVANEKEAKKNEADAKKQRDDARDTSTKLQEVQDELRRTLYAAHMNLVQAAWDADNVGRVVQLLEQQRPGPGEPELRGFEWHYWQRRCHTELRTWKVPGLPVRAAFGLAAGLSSDGTRLAVAVPNTGKPGCHVRVWDTETGRELLAVPGGEGTMSHMVFSLDGKRVAATGTTFSSRTSPANQPGGLRVWDIAARKELLAISKAWHASSIAFSPDGARIAVAVLDSDWTKAPSAGEIQVWDVAAGKELFTIATTGSTLEVTFSPDGKRLAASVHDYTAKRQPGESRVLVWDAGTGKELVALKASPDSSFGSVAFSPDGTRLAAGTAGPSESGEMKVWDAMTGKELLTIPDHSHTVNNKLIFSPDGKRLAGFGFDSPVKVWDLAPRKAGSAPPSPHTLKGHTGPISALAFSADGTRIHTVGWDGTMKVWNAAQTDKPADPKLPGDVAAKVAISPDGTRIALSMSAFGDATGEMIVTDGAGKDLLHFKVPAGHSHELLFSPDGKRLGCAWHGNPLYELRVWDVVTGKELLIISAGPDAAVSGVAFSPDGQRIASTVSVSTPQNDPRVVESQVKVWDVATSKELLALPKRSGAAFTNVAFSPDGTRLAATLSLPESAGNEGEFEMGGKVWDAATGAELLTLKWRGPRAIHLLFSPDGARLAAGGGHIGEPCEVQVWSVDTGAGLLTLKGSSGNLDGLVFSPDGKRIATVAGNFASGTSEVKVWDAASGRELLTLKGTHRISGSIAFSPDGNRLISVGGYRSRGSPVQVWDATPRPEEGTQQKE